MSDEARISILATRLPERLRRGPATSALLSFPWDTTPLGPIDAWPEQLLLLAQVMLTSEFPMMIVWGPTYIQLYNDAFRPILGSGKHPDAMGGEAKRTWSEIWDEIGPLFAGVYQGDAVRNVDQRLIINRNGFPEETFFTYSYSPIHDENNDVAGLLVVATETTPSIVDRRRLAGLGSLASALVGATTVDGIAKATVQSLRESAVIESVEVNLVVADRLVRIASSHPTLTRFGNGRLLRDVAITGEPVVLDPDWEPGRPAHQVAIGIDDPNLRTVIVFGLNAGRPFDDGYRQFVRLLRQTIASSITAALLREAELDALRHISDTLQHAMLELASDLPTVAARYLPHASDLTVGGDWYEVIDLGGGRRGLIVGDCVGHGLEAATAMGALRNVSRALLSEGRGPADVIDSLHRYATTMPAAACATVVCAIVDLAAQTITYSNAGHPPPLLVRADDAVWLEGALAPPLGVGEPERVEACVGVRPGDLFVLYTDGLVERPGEVLDRGLERLAECAISTRDESVQDIADHLIARLVDADDRRDDIALVVKRVH